MNRVEIISQGNFIYFLYARGFDLDKKDWTKSFTDKHLESLSQRISTKSGISDSDRAATLDFIACVRKGDC